MGTHALAYKIIFQILTILQIYNYNFALNFDCKPFFRILTSFASFHSPDHHKPDSILSYIRHYSRMNFKWSLLNNKNGISKIQRYFVVSFLFISSEFYGSRLLKLFVSSYFPLMKYISCHGNRYWQHPERKQRSPFIHHTFYLVNFLYNYTIY